MALMDRRFIARQADLDYAYLGHEPVLVTPEDVLMAERAKAVYFPFDMWEDRPAMIHSALQQGYAPAISLDAGPNGPVIPRYMDPAEGRIYSIADNVYVPGMEQYAIPFPAF